MSQTWEAAQIRVQAGKRGQVMPHPAVVVESQRKGAS